MIKLFFVLFALFTTTISAPNNIRVIDNEIIICVDGPGKAIRKFPSVAYGDSVYMVVWQEGWNGKNGKARIFAARVNTNGQLLDSAGIEIAPCSTGVQEQPRIAFSQGTFLIVWQDMRNGNDFDVLGARISPAGTVLDSVPIPFAVAARSQVLPDLSESKTGFIVVWQGFQSTGSSTQLFGAIVDAADGSITPLSLSLYKSNPRIAWNGIQFLLTFKAPSGTVQYVSLDSNGIAVSTPIDLYGGVAFGAVSATPNKGWKVVMHREDPDYWGWGGPGAIMCYAITSTGLLFTSTQQPCYQCTATRYDNWLDYSIFNSPGTPWPWGRTSVVWDGKQSIAAWIRYKLGGSTGIQFTNGSIVAGRVTEWGKYVDTFGVYVARTADNEVNPVLASNGNQQLLCVYEKRLQSGSNQITAKMISTNDTGIAVEQSQHLAYTNSTEMTISPNPISASATISIVLPSMSSSIGRTRVDIYNLQGEKIATLEPNNVRSNVLKYDWNIKNMASGLFLARIKINGQEIRKKILLTR
jgi:hypothetical protein